MKAWWFPRRGQFYRYFPVLQKQLYKFSYQTRFVHIYFSVTAVDK